MRGGRRAIALSLMIAVHTALELRVLIHDARRPDTTGFFLVNVNRSRVDRLGGLLSLIIRSTILHRTRDGMAAYLRSAKQTLEQGWRGQATTSTAARVRPSAKQSRTFLAR